VVPNKATDFLPAPFFTGLAKIRGDRRLGLAKMFLPARHPWHQRNATGTDTGESSAEFDPTAW
jgi:hypothetical protein